MSVEAGFEFSTTAPVVTITVATPPKTEFTVDHPESKIVVD